MAHQHLIYGVISRRFEYAAGAGALWLPWERRGDFLHLWRLVLAHPDAPRRPTWRRVKKRTFPFYEELVDTFLGREWLRFQCVIAPAPDDPREADGSMREQLGALVARGARTAGGGRAARFRLRVDPRVGAVDAGPRVELREAPRRDTPGLLLAELLLAAVQGAHEVVEGRAQERLVTRVERAMYDDTERCHIWRREELATPPPS